MFKKLSFLFSKSLETNNIQQIKNHGKPNEERNTYYSTEVDTAVINEIPRIFVGNMYFIVTEDIEGKTLKNMCNFVNIEQEFSQIIKKYNKLISLNNLLKKKSSNI